jgi:hypothetical protein
MADEVELHSTKANTDPHRDHSRLFYFGIAAVAVAATEPLFHHRFNDDCRPRMEVCSAIDLMSLLFRGWAWLLQTGVANAAKGTPVF